ncbi:hypothetical protein Cpin_0269 [Chitinophaga pinensis DSM 2588]|uniref:Uncharacterized protein n=1 Tax=Chitinophaga pinensis (strain ATCC 43595 / DSM 2588 / LMG 13176 / NBRC 15968 / NCIMB 11800 / UQM 2034) TaxID=485918 RepID=A0A979GPY2_CHIPD|nr:hypothetical protein Cpin_0269 [Chitinophaga pinensis DSM 2588]
MNSDIFGTWHRYNCPTRQGNQLKKLIFNILYIKVSAL